MPSVGRASPRHAGTPRRRSAALLGLALVFAAPVPFAAAAPTDAGALVGHAPHEPPPVEPPPAPRIAVLTMSPGAHPFERFGHAAILVDVGRGEPLVYNYGTYDGDDPLVLRKFLANRLPYWLSVMTWRETQARYVQRSITLQELTLDEDEAWDLAAMLQRNALPDRRTYRYDFFRDNCSTRVRDMVEQATRALLDRASTTPGHHSHRDHLDVQLASIPLLRRAIDLALNAETDRPLTRWDDAFLPIELAQLLREARRSDGRPLVARESTWTGAEYDPHLAGAPDLFALGALAILALLALGAALGRHRALGRVATGGGLALFGAAGGLLGCGLVATSLTPYEVGRWNGNLLAFSPLLFLLVAPGLRLATGRLALVGLRRLRLLVVALASPALVDAALHTLHIAKQHHAAVLAVALLAAALVVVALRSIRVVRARAADRSAARLAAAAVAPVDG